MRSGPARGMFGNGIAYTRYRGGPASLVCAPGGPGNVLLSGILEWMNRRMLCSIVDGYPVWNVTRRQNMHPLTPSGNGR